jgi:hypothetical protein
MHRHRSDKYLNHNLTHYEFHLYKDLIISLKAIIYLFLRLNPFFVGIG